MILFKGLLSPKKNSKLVGESLFKDSIYVLCHICILVCAFGMVFNVLRPIVRKVKYRAVITIIYSCINFI